MREDARLKHGQKLRNAGCEIVASLWFQPEVVSSLRPTCLSPGNTKASFAEDDDDKKVEDKAGPKLVHDEERDKGKVSMGTYGKYFRNGGIVLSVFTLSLCVIGQVCADLGLRDCLTGLWQALVCFNPGSGREARFAVGCTVLAEFSLQLYATN